MKNRATALPDSEFLDQIRDAVIARLREADQVSLPSKQWVERSNRSRDAF
jgi:hypothetical protein